MLNILRACLPEPQLNKNGNIPTLIVKGTKKGCYGILFSGFRSHHAPLVILAYVAKTRMHFFGYILTGAAAKKMHLRLYVILIRETKLLFTSRIAFILLTASVSINITYAKQG